MAESRTDWIDISKGFGIILVVYGHVVRGIDNSSLAINEEFFHISDTFVYSFHMPLFFFLSGIFFEKSIKKYTSKGLFIEKCKTILYPFIIWSLLQTIIEFGLSRFTNGNVEFNNILTCIFRPRAQFWFLYALFFINVINIILFSFFKKKWLIISLIIAIIYYEYPINLSVFSSTFKYLIFFNLGILISNHLLNNILLKQISHFKNLILILIIFIIVEYLYIIYSLDILFKLLIPPILGIVVIISISYLLDERKACSNHLSSLGKNSMYIYILHILVASGTRIILTTLFHIDSTILHIIIGTLMGIYIPYLVTKFFKNNKFYLKLFSLK